MIERPAENFYQPRLRALKFHEARLELLQDFGEPSQPGAVNDDVMDCRIELVETPPVVQRDDADSTPAAAPLVCERGDDALDAACIEAVADEDEGGKGIHGPGHIC